MNASAVHATLAKHYPTHVLGWVKRATWKHDPAVPLTRIDMARRPGARNPEKVAGIAEVVKAGKPIPPVVLVDTGEPKLAIADGYHRTLGFLHAGKRAIPAVIASGVGRHGPWEKRMHAAKLNLTAAHVHTVDLASVCTGPGPCDTTPLGTGKNWLRKVNGLPDYIRAIAHSLRRDHGMDESRAIATAIATVKRWAAGGGNVSAETRARAVKAVAEWEAKKAASHALTAAPAATVDLTFTENLHPRAPKGVSNGGKFVAKNGGSGGEKSVGATYQAQVRDFQKRTGLTVTGKLDTATRAKMAKLRKPSSGGGSSKTKKAAAASRHTATASAVNGLTDAQREQFRILRPTPPPGYHWDHNNRLVRATPQSRRIHRILGLNK